MAKTPDYTRKAVKEYQQNLVRKNVSLDTRKADDEELIKMIEADDMSFNQRVKDLLSKFYGVRKMSEKTYTLEEIESKGWENGWVFGKYTVQADIDDDLLAVLDSVESAIIAYKKGYDDGFKAGLAESPRVATLDEINNGY